MIDEEIKNSREMARYMNSPEFRSLDVYVKNKVRYQIDTIHTLKELKEKIMEIKTSNG